MKLSVVILNYKVPYHLYLCVDSVVKAIEGLDVEVIVVDNASADESEKLITENFPSVRWIQLTSNSGFSSGNNKAVAHARGEYLLLLNPDTFVGEDTFAYLLKKIDTFKRLGALGVQLIDGRGGFLPESKRNFPSFSAVRSKFFGDGKNYYAQHIDKDKNGKVDVLVGAFMLMKTEEYKKVGGLDERYFMYGEDIDLSFQFIKNKRVNYYEGEVCAVHFKGESTQKDRLYWQRFYEAMFLFYDKNFPEDKFTKQLIKFATTSLSWIMSATRKQKNEAVRFYNWLLFSKDLETKDRIAKALGADVFLATEEILKKVKNTSTCIIFDANVMDYARIISLMKEYQHQNLYFRLIPRKANFMLGSDASDTKGEVLFL